MKPEAKKLMSYMSNLSEEAYCAGWIEGLEYALWKAVLEGSYNYGRLSITDEHTVKLKELSENCGGWIVFDDVEGETFVSLDQWQSMYEVERKRLVNG